MRKSKISASDMEARELSEYNRRHKRDRAFDTMKIRDRGWVRLSNGVILHWPVTNPPEELVPRQVVPEGTFMLSIGDQTAVFDLDEFRMWLRWA